MTAESKATETKTTKQIKIEEIKPEEDDDICSCRTFVIHKEDHTLGNALRYVTMKDPRVEFCGYSVPHPSEDKINFRVQTGGSCSAEDALRTGLDNLHSAAEVLLKKFDNALDKHGQAKPTPMDES